MGMGGGGGMGMGGMGRPVMRSAGQPFMGGGAPPMGGESDVLMCVCLLIFFFSLPIPFGFHLDRFQTTQPGIPSIWRRRTGRRQPLVLPSAASKCIPSTSLQRICVTRTATIRWTWNRSWAGFE